MIQSVMARSRTALEQLGTLDDLKPYVDTARGLPTPFMGSGKIRLVIIGQDPTVLLEKSRNQITTVLNLNKGGGLRRFLSEVCAGLGVSLDENVYATNVCKNFFTMPPTKIKAMDVIAASAPLWLPVLDNELQQFPDALVMSLGQPVLSVLVKPGYSRKMVHYWGRADNKLTHILAEQSSLNRAIFPMVHLNSWQTQAFYRGAKAGYLSYIRGHLA